MYQSDRSLYVMYRSDTSLYDVSVGYITLRCIGTYVMYRDRVALTSLNQMNLRLVVINGKMRHFQPIKSIWGLAKFISHNTFKEASNGYLVDDKCVLGAEIFIVQRQAIGECLSMVKSTDSFKREWKICNFSKLGENWVSEEFTVGGYKWKLSLYPKGNANNKGCDISIFLKSVDAKDFDHHEKVKAVNAIFTFFVFNQLRDNYLSARGKMRRFQSIKSFWGLAKFISHNTFKETSNGYFVDDKCVVGAEIFVVQGQGIGECLSMVKSTDSFKREWKICSFSNLGEEWFSEEFNVDDYKWKLWLFPKGNGNSEGCDISIFLKSVDAKDFDHHQKVKANCSISLKDQINGGCKKLSCKPNVFFFSICSLLIFYMEFLQDEYHCDSIATSLFHNIIFLFGCLIVSIF
uniref:Nucleic acid binding protein n=1 Tax=Solanum tuberosum TaxID=4113 RepID=M0ZJ52_SOLTU